MLVMILRCLLLLSVIATAMACDHACTFGSSSCDGTSILSQCVRDGDGEFTPYWETTTCPGYCVAYSATGHECAIASMPDPSCSDSTVVSFCRNNAVLTCGSGYVTSSTDCGSPTCEQSTSSATTTTASCTM